MIQIEDLALRLCDLGFEVPENHSDMLKEAVKRAEQCVMNTCNCENVPEELSFVALDIAAGEYLLAARCKGEDFLVESVSEGDVSVSFKDESPVDGIIDMLLNSGRDEMLSFRRVKW